MNETQNFDILILKSYIEAENERIFLKFKSSYRFLSDYKQFTYTTENCLTNEENNTKTFEGIHEQTESIFKHQFRLSRERSKSKENPLKIPKLSKMKDNLLRKLNEIKGILKK